MIDPYIQVITTPNMMYLLETLKDKMVKVNSFCHKNNDYYKKIPNDDSWVRDIGLMEGMSLIYSYKDYFTITDKGIDVFEKAENEILVFNSKIQ